MSEYTKGHGQQEEAEQRILFRNYKPVTSLLEGRYEIKKSEPETITHRIQEKLDLLKEGEDKYRVDPCMFDPKKDDFDLKRRIQPKLDKLDRETRKMMEQIRSKNKKR